MSIPDPRYDEFVACTAQHLVDLPPTVVSSLNGWQFRQLGPEMYRAVREGEQKFGRPVQSVYDDLFAAISRLAKSPRFVRTWIRLVNSYLVNWYKLARTAYVIPKILEKVKGPDPQPPTGAPARNDRTAPPRASVVMVSFNRLEYLKTSLFAFWETVGDASHELIVVDNGSDDGSREFLEEAYKNGWISKLLTLEENLGNSGGSNRGFALADPGSDFLMKLDSDIKVTTNDWLNSAMSFLDSHPQVGFVSLNQTNIGHLMILPKKTLGEWTVMDFGEWTLGSAMLMTRQAFDALGLFVERAGRTYVLDDVDYYVRVARSGREAFHLADLHAFHQFQLDQTAYRNYTSSKAVKGALDLALNLAKEYDRGDRPLEAP